MDYSAHATTVILSEHCLNSKAESTRSTPLLSCKFTTSLKLTCNTEMSTEANICQENAKDGLIEVSGNAEDYSLI